MAETTGQTVCAMDQTYIHALPQRRRRDIAILEELTLGELQGWL
jgi:hypothetical protein